LLIKYEDLRIEPLTELRKVYSFIGVEASDSTLQNIIDKYSFEKVPASEKGEGKVIRKAKPGGWRDCFSEEEKDIMNSIMGDMLRALGYEV
jgi:hypothetical protein